MSNYRATWIGPNPIDGMMIGFGATPTAALPDALELLEHAINAHG